MPERNNYTLERAADQLPLRLTTPANPRYPSTMTIPTPHTIKRYELSLPTFKQGDDMAHCLEKKGNDSAAALLMLADLYTECARLVRRAASVAAEGDLKVTDADVHYISVSGTPARLDALVAEHVLYVHEDEYEDDEMDPAAADGSEDEDDAEETVNLDDGTSRGSRW